MQKTNNRIYKAFQDLDTYLSQHPGLPQSRFGWAGRYKTDMNNYVQYRNQATTRLLPGLLTNIGADLNVANNNVAGKVQATWDQWNNLYNSMRTYYNAPGNGAAQIAWEITWEWNIANVKRDEIDQIIKKRQACSQPITPSSIADPTATASSISTPPETSSALSTVPDSGSGLTSSASAVPSQATTAPAPAATLTFTCTTVPNHIDPDYPCLCSDGRSYCDESGPCESFTTRPYAENCCEDYH